LRAVEKGFDEEHILLVQMLTREAGLSREHGQLSSGDFVKCRSLID
jgi:hypothetical protein